MFVGGWTLESATAVCRPGEIGLDPLEGMASLLDQSLIRRDEGVHGESRFGMLETIREFALERLHERGEGADLARRHAEHFTAVAEAAEPDLTKSTDAVERVDHDHDNFRAALTWAIESDRADLGMRLGFGLWRFWQLRAHLAEGRMWFDRLLALPSAAPRTADRAKGLTGAAGIAYWQNDYPAATAWYEAAEAIYREQGDRRGLADALYSTGSMAGIEGDMDRVRAIFSEGGGIARELGDDQLVLRFLEAEGYMAFMTDDFDTARPRLEEALTLAQKSGDRLAIGTGH
ncbi:MAG: hypothetical protein ACREKB_10600, partial [Candidatus Rokuibacteriota bacterium]